MPMSESTYHDEVVDETYEGDVVRVEGSEVVHLLRDGAVICGQIADIERDDVSIANFEAATEFFDVCSACRYSYHPDYEQSVQSLKEDIAREIGEPLPPAGTFNQRHFRRIHRRLVTDDSGETADPSSTVTPHPGGDE